MPLQRNNYCWDVFAKQFGVNWFYGGEILLTYGNWRIIIHTKTNIKDCWISTSESENTIPVCCGDITTVGSKIYNNRVEIDVRVRSDLMNLNYWFQF